MQGLDNNTTVMVFTSDQLQCPYDNATITSALWKTSLSPIVTPFVAAIEIIIYTIALLWNIFIVMFMIIKRKNLKEPHNIFLVSLSLTNLTATVITAPFFVSTVIRGEWFFGTTDCDRQSSCKAVGFFFSLSLLSQLSILSAMSFDRYLALEKPIRYSTFMTWRKAVIITLGVLVISIFPCMTPLFGFGVFFYEPRLGACLFRWTGQAPYVAFFLGLVAVIATITVVFTVLTYWKIRKFLKNRFQFHTKKYAFKKDIPEQEKLYNAQQSHLLLLFTTLLIILTMCWLPVVSTGIASAVVTPGAIPPAIYMIDLMIAIGNFAINPIVQTAFTKDIRKLLYRVICCKLSNMKKGSHSKGNTVDVIMSAI